MEVIAQLHPWSLYLRGETPLSIQKKAVCKPDKFCALKRRKILLFCRDMYPVPSTCILVTIPTTLIQLPPSKMVYFLTRGQNYYRFVCFTLAHKYHPNYLYVPLTIFSYKRCHSNKRMPARTRRRENTVSIDKSANK